MQHIHLVGIGGTGLSAIAKLLKESGYQVSGSDQSLGPLARNLQQMGISVYTGHRAENIQGADAVVQSSAIGPDNPEIRAALAAGIPVYKRAEFLGQFIQGKNSIAIAGTHGKTTTTSMITWILHQLGRNPSYIVGGVIKGLESNAAAGSGEEFVIEADEYDRMFLGLHPRMAITTALEHDHPDCFPTMEDYTQAFYEFIATIQPGGCLITCGDQPATASFLQHLPMRVSGFSYGLSEGCDFQAINLRVENGTYTFDFIQNRGGKICQLAKDVHLQVAGQHNVQNAAAALAAMELIGLNLTKAAEALATFQGSGRRFELVGEVGRITLIDDYAHHPTEISATLSAARVRFPGRRIWAVWQPHTYSRTRLLKDQFLNALSLADEVVITEIYAAREAKEDFSSAEVAREVPGGKARFTASLTEASHLLLDNLQAGDVVVVLSAGDADQINRQLFTWLSERTEDYGRKEHRNSSSKEYKHVGEDGVPADEPGSGNDAADQNARRGLHKQRSSSGGLETHSVHENHLIASERIRLPGILTEKVHLHFGDRLQENVSLGRYTTARIGGLALGLVEIRTTADLVDAIAFLTAEQMPFKVIGGGSNLLISDAGFQGVVVINRSSEYYFETREDGYYLYCDSGVNLGSLARKAALQGFSGLEWAAGIPGTVGGAVYGNAGAHGSNIQSHLAETEVLIHGIERSTWTADEMQYGYRISRLKKQPQNVVILQSVLRGVVSSTEVIRQRMDEFARKRKANQPKGASLGSIFKNPPDDYAGRLIEAAGLKGTRVGGIQVSTHHANFFINDATGNATDYYRLIRLVQKQVMERFGVLLETEIEFLGNFTDGE